MAWDEGILLQTIMNTQYQIHALPFKHLRNLIWKVRYSVVWFSNCSEKYFVFGCSCEFVVVFFSSFDHISASFNNDDYLRAIEFQLWMKWFSIELSSRIYLRNWFLFNNNTVFDLFKSCWAHLGYELPICAAQIDSNEMRGKTLLLFTHCTSSIALLYCTTTDQAQFIQCSKHIGDGTEWVRSAKSRKCIQMKCHPTNWSLCTFRSSFSFFFYRIR